MNVDVNVMYYVNFYSHRTANSADVLSVPYLLDARQVYSPSSLTIKLYTVSEL